VKSSRSSDTAKLIARSVILASNDGVRSQLVTPEAIELLEQLRGKDWFSRASNFVLFRKVVLAGERFLLSGIITHYLVRKLHIEREVEKAIAEGCRRVVVLGAGYDTLAWRLHRKHREIQFVEIDHPATQRVKAGRMEVDQNLRLEPLDLSKGLPSSVLESDDSATAFVIEGLTMYLTPERVEELLKDVSSLAGEAGKVIWTFMERQENGSLGFQGENPLIPRWLEFCNEPFRWGISREELADFTARCGLEVQRLGDHQSLRLEYLISKESQALPLARGELICISTTTVS
jgi:methyltransferase (TIGR00027 family)